MVYLPQEEYHSWTPECQDAFDALKWKLVEAPILVYSRLQWAILHRSWLKFERIRSHTISKSGWTENSTNVTVVGFGSQQNTSVIVNIHIRQLFRTTTLNNYSEQLLRITTPDDYSGRRHRTQGFSVPSPRTGRASGKLPTRLPVSPVPVMSSSKFAGLGWNTLMPYGGLPPYAGPWPALSGHLVLSS